MSELSRAVLLEPEEQVLLWRLLGEERAGTAPKTPERRLIDGLCGTLASAPWADAEDVPQLTEEPAPLKTLREGARGLVEEMQALASTVQQLRVAKAPRDDVWGAEDAAQALLMAVQLEASVLLESLESVLVSAKTMQ